MRVEPRRLVLADERLAQLPGVGVGKVARDRSHRRSPNRGRPAICEEKTPSPAAISAESSRCCGDSKRRPRLERAQLRRRGIDQPVGRHHPGRRGKAEAPRGQAVDRLPLDRRRAAGVRAGADDLLGERRSIPPMRPWRRASSICAEAVSGSPASDAHIAWTSCANRRVVFADAALDRAKRRRVGVGKRALHRDLHHLRREAVGIDAGDQHARRIRLAHAQQQPGALGDPVDRVDVARRARLGEQRIAKRDMRPARRDRRVHPAHQASTGKRRWPRPRDRRRGRAQPDRARRRPTDRAAPSRDIRSAAAAGCGWRLGGVTTSTRRSHRARSRRGRPAAARLRSWAMARSAPARRGAGCATCCAIAGKRERDRGRSDQ